MTLLDDVASIANQALGADRTVVLAAVGGFDRRALLAAHHAVTVPAARRAAIHVVEDEGIAGGLARGWMAADVPLSLELLYAPGSVAEAIRDAVRDERRSGADRVVVVVARQSLERLWHRALHDQTADAIVTVLARERDVLTVVVAVPAGKGTPGRRRTTTAGHERPGVVTGIRRITRRPLRESAAARPRGDARRWPRW